MKALLLSFILLTGCGAGAQGGLEQAIHGATVSVDIVYAATVQICDAKEKQIIDRQGTTEAQDIRDIGKVRAVCDQIFTAVDNMRRLGPRLAQLRALDLTAGGDDG